jgi:two-component system cell cycle response regulator
VTDFFVILGFGATLGALLVWFPAAHWRRNRMNRLRTELKRTEDRAFRLAAMDPLTGLFNRRRIFETLLVEHERTRRAHLPYAVIMVKPHAFHRVNDTHGQAVGDALLREIGRMCQSEARETDIIGHWKGATFVLLCPGADGQAAGVLAERLLTRVEGATFAEVGRLKLVLGLALSNPDQADTPDAALGRAEAALRQDSLACAAQDA